jgi:hypothetical protein
MLLKGLTKRNRWLPLDDGTQDWKLRRICYLDNAVATHNGVNLSSSLLLPLRMQHHGKEEAVERSTNRKYRDGTEHPHRIGCFMFVEAKRASASIALSFPSFEVGPRVAEIRLQKQSVCAKWSRGSLLRLYRNLLTSNSMC